MLHYYLFTNIIHLKCKKYLSQTSTVSLSKDMHVLFKVNVHEYLYHSVLQNV